MVLYGTFVKNEVFFYDRVMAADTSDSISDRIVASAARRFVEEGYAATSTLAIARDAKTSKREIYDRFGSKEKLFEHVMNYLCALGDQTDVSAGASDLPGIMADTAHAVLNRFLLPETRGVLVAALGADQKFPEIPQIFWNAGPGQAVAALRDLFLSNPDIKISDPQTAEKTAHAFIMSCVGPSTLSFLFDREFGVDRAARNDIVERAVAETLRQIT